jgi:OmcA/MtrC family decaheme c-type cytochrome
MNATDDLNAPHRIGVRITNLTDADGNKLPDYVWSNMTYVPATGEVGVASGKDTVANQACMNCHGENPATGGIAAPIGHRNQNVENCVLCHTPALQPNADDAAKGYVFDLPAMIHRIHGGEHLAKLSTYGFKQTAEWAEIPYPAPLDQCTVCHSNDEGKTSWKDEPTRAACVGCHSNIDFTTGAGHSEFNLAQADDSQCAACHSTGALSPMVAHKVGTRAEYKDLVKVNFTGAEKSGAAGSQVVTLTADVTINGTPIAQLSDLSVLGVDSLLVGNVDARGEVTRWGISGLGLKKADNQVVNGKLVITVPVTDAQATGSIYVGTQATFCVNSAGKAATCDPAATDLIYGLPYANIHGSNVPSTALGVGSTINFFNLDGGAIVKSRYVDPARITVEETKCNACHTTLDYAKGATHGTYTFDQCMDCHNNNYAGSYHPDTQILTLGKNAEGNIEVQSAAAGSATFHNRDLVTVAHRFHSGNMNSNTTEVAGVFLDNTGELHGYPAPSSDCSVCHKDGAKLFAEDGGLTSGKRSIAVTGGYISPVAESCRSCHTSGAALAHFKSNGATTDDAPDSTADLPIESCSTCHAQGKSYGIDKFHIMK